MTCSSRGFLPLIVLFLHLITTTSAHMALAEPPPINAKNNPFHEPSHGDWDYTAPLSPSGSNYPCRGHLKDLGTPRGRSVRTYKPGGTYTMSFTGGAPHNGGSCQASLSYDRGTTFKVINSYIGGCPLQPVQFTIPANAPTGDEVIFAWTWFNNLGNREMYMNCAVVTISHNARKRALQLGAPYPEDAHLPLNSTITEVEGDDSNEAENGEKEEKEETREEYEKRLSPRNLNGPGIFIANVGNGCLTAHGTDVVFPSPGSSISYGNGGQRSDPVGTCDGRVFRGGGAYGNTAGSNNGGGGGDDGSWNGGAVPGQEGGENNRNRGCDYWKAQGYVCSDGEKRVVLGLGRWGVLMAALVGPILRGIFL